VGVQVRKTEGGEEKEDSEKGRVAGGLACKVQLRNGRRTDGNDAVKEEKAADHNSYNRRRPVKRKTKKN